MELDEEGLWIAFPPTVGNVVSRKLVASEGKASKLGRVTSGGVVTYGKAHVSHRLPLCTGTLPSSTNFPALPVSLFLSS